MAENMALFEISDWAWKPQFVVTASANFSFRTNHTLMDFSTETMDARFGFTTEWSVNPHLRFSVGFLHLSGHGVDGLLDADLGPPNLGTMLSCFASSMIGIDGFAWEAP